MMQAEGNAPGRQIAYAVRAREQLRLTELSTDSASRQLRQFVARQA